MLNPPFSISACPICEKNHITPPYFFLDGDWQCATSSASVPHLFPEKACYPRCRRPSKSYAFASAPYDALGSDLQPLRIWKRAILSPGLIESVSGARWSWTGNWN